MGDISDASSGSGTTYSNAGIGPESIAIILTKLGNNLPFKAIAPSSDKVVLVDNTGTKEVEIDVDETQLRNFQQINVSGVKYNSISKVAADSGYTVTALDKTVRIDATAGAFTLNLLSASSAGAGKEYTIRRTDILASTNLIKITPNGTDTIDGAPYLMLIPGEYATLQSDGTSNWSVISRTNITNLMYYLRKGATADRTIIAGNQGMYGSMQTSTTSPAANTLWAIPFVIPKATKFSTIRFNITTGSAGVNARAGIYRDDGNSYPGAFIFDTLSIDCTAAGVKNTTITAALQVLPAGLYWLAWECSGATLQISIIGTTATNLSVIGHSNTFGTNAYGYSVAHTFGTLPDPFTAGASILSAAPAPGNPVPAIGLVAI